jgi:hypothetical protein
MIRLFAAALVAAVLPAACGAVPGNSPQRRPLPCPTAVPTPTPPAARRPEKFDPPAPSPVGRWRSIWLLTGRLGPSSPPPYLERQLEGFGCDVELQPFSFGCSPMPAAACGARRGRWRRCPFEAPPGSRKPSLSMPGSAAGRLPRRRGKIALIKRGPLLLGQGGERAEAAAPPSTTTTRPVQRNLSAAIPVLSMSKTDGEALLAVLAEGTVSRDWRCAPSARATRRTSSRGRRTKPGDRRGHYDSVPPARRQRHASGTAGSGDGPRPGGRRRLMTPASCCSARRRWGLSAAPLSSTR